MFEFTRQHSSVELVELHQLDQVGEFGGAVVKAEEDLAVLFALRRGEAGGERERARPAARRKAPRGEGRGEEEIRIFSPEAPIALVSHVWACQHKVSFY